jgi:Ion channel
MKSNRLYRFLGANTLAIPLIVVVSIIILGGIGVYLAEHKHPGANITNLGDAFWWAVETITTVGYGDYTPVTTIGRIIAVFVMFSGIGIVVSVLGILAQRRLQRVESRFKSKTEVQPRLLVDETKTLKIGEKTHSRLRKHGRIEEYDRPLPTDFLICRTNQTPCQQVKKILMFCERNSSFQYWMNHCYKMQ